MAQKSSPTSQDKTLFSFAPPMDLQATMDINQKLLKAMQVYNEELVTFGNNRLKEDLAVSQKLAECKTAQDFIGVYTDFYQRALKQYAEEAQTLANIYTVFTSEKDKATVASNKPENSDMPESKKQE
ncbi:MAG: phasin family protein [Sneathiella sp.]|nr:phasin family protein [Sneathiella sp.]